MAATAVSPRTAHAPRVLFVDDEPSLRQLGDILLSRRGYEVQMAENGIAALEVLRSFVADLIISDLRMPKMSGFEFLSIVRRRFPAIPIIAISGEFLSQSEMMGIADAFFSKGNYTPDQLIAKVEALLSAPRVAQQLGQPPMWVPVSPSGDVVLTCTECLRSFPVRACPPQAGNPLRVTTCIVCGSSLKYCIDSTTLPAHSSSDCGFIRIH